MTNRLERIAAVEYAIRACSEPTIPDEVEMVQAYLEARPAMDARTRHQVVHLMILTRLRFITVLRGVRENAEQPLLTDARTLQCNYIQFQARVTHYLLRKAEWDRDGEKQPDNRH